jgi:8-oxo-dGTP pyrophosphatase MutT (NUDIX family)
MDRTLVDAGKAVSMETSPARPDKKMRPERIRPIAICVCRDARRILVTEFRTKGRLYYRPIGGTIEFGERGEEAVRREFREEIAAELIDVRFLGTLENIYTAEGRRGHEIVLVYDGRLADASLYQKDVIQGDEGGVPFRAVWKEMNAFGPGRPPVYPDGLLRLLTD